jgi:hypothetical protein
MLVSPFRAGPVASHRNPGLSATGTSGLAGSPAARVDGVVAARREVVGGVGMKQGGEVLRLPAPRPELELAAAVGADAALGAVVVGGAEPGQRADPRGLDVDHPRRERERLDVGDRVDRGVPGDPVVVGGEHGGGRRSTMSGSSSHASGTPRPPAGRAPGRRLVDDRPVVEGLEVDRVDRAGRDQRRDQLGRPRARGVELEAQRRVALEARVIGSSVGGSPSRSETTKVTGCGARRAPRAAAARPGAAPGRARRCGTSSAGTAARRRAAARPGTGRASRSARRSRRARSGRQVVHRPGLLERGLVDAVVDDVLADPSCWPTEYGGRGATLIEQAIYNEERSCARRRPRPRTCSASRWAGRP